MSILAQLFPAIPPSTFLAKHFFAGVPLTTHGPLSRLELPQLPGRLSVDEILTTHDSLIAVMRGRDGLPRNIRVARGQGVACFRAGSTIFCEQLQNPSVAQLSAGLLKETGFPPACGANSLFIGLKDTGSAWHCDTKDIFVLQLCGAKRWQFAPNEDAERAVVNVWPDTTRPLPRNWGPNRPIQEVVLEPGSVLFLPRNWWHQTLAVEEPCMALTSGIRRPTYLALMLAAIHCDLAEVDEWLAPSGPVLGVGDRTTPTISALRERARGLSERLTTLDYGTLVAAASRIPAVRRQYANVCPMRVRHDRGEDGDCFVFDDGSTRRELRCGTEASGIVELVLKQDASFSAAQLAEECSVRRTPETIHAVIESLLKLGVVEDRYATRGVRVTDLAAFQSVTMGP